MGQKQSTNYVYALPIGEQKEGESHVYRHKDHTDGLIKYAYPNIKTVQELIEHGYKQHKNKPLIGKQHPKTRKYIYKTYGEEYEDARRVGSAIYHNNLYFESTEYQNYKLKFMGIFMSNCIEWNTIDMACSLYNIVLVPFYDNLVSKDISYILNQTKLTTVFCTEKQAQSLLDTEDIASLQNIVMVGKLNTDDRQRAKNRNIKIYEYRNLLSNINSNNNQNNIANGIQNASNVNTILELPKDIQPTDIYTFSYTSGSTGIPKAVMMTNLSFIAPISAMKELNLNQNDRMLCYLPLPHGTSRFCSMLSWYFGSRIGFSCGDITKLNEDLQILKPTVFITVPTLFNKYYEVINDQFNKIQGCKGSLIKKAISVKLKNLKEKNILTHSVYDPLIFNKIKNIFGGCIRTCISASAPISKEVLDFFKISLGIPVLEAFGLTEAGGMQFCTHRNDINASGMVGGVRANVEVKLIDIPEMGYYSTDMSDEGYPLPRGEICTRGPGICAGYFKDEEKTKEMLDENGWLHSGDIGILYNNGCIRVLGRKANVFKLKNGKFISPERIENAFIRVKGVSEVFITSNGSEEYIVAIVVPKKEVVLELLQQQFQQKIKNINNIINNKTDINKGTFTGSSMQGTRMNFDEENNNLQQSQNLSYEDGCKDNFIQEWFLKNLEECSKNEQLHSNEYPKKIILETSSFFSLGLYTQSLKLQRFFARKHFLSQLEKI